MSEPFNVFSRLQTAVGEDPRLNQIFNIAEVVKRMRKARFGKDKGEEVLKAIQDLVNDQFSDVHPAELVFVGLSIMVVGLQEVNDGLENTREKMQSKEDQ